MRIKIFILLLICLLSISARADTALENETLARIVHVLDSLQPLIQEAQAQQESGERVQFDYVALRQDIQRVKTGIQRKFAENRLEPRIIKPIQGDYLIIRSQTKS